MNIRPFAPREDLRPPATWRGLLEGARSEHEVVSIARDFAASFAPVELDAMPIELRPRKLSDAEDVADYAFELIRFRLQHGEGTPPIVARFADFHAQASIRTSQIAWLRRQPDYIRDSA